MVPGEQIIQDPADISAPETTDRPESEVDVNTLTPEDGKGEPEHPEYPKGPLPGDAVSADQEEQPAKKSIRKVNTADEDKPKPQVKEDVATTDRANDGQEVSDNLNYQMNPAEAVAYAATQTNPKEAIDTLRRQRRLTEVTDTYKLLDSES